MAEELNEQEIVRAYKKYIKSKYKNQSINDMLMVRAWKTLLCKLFAYNLISIPTYCRYTNDKYCKETLLVSIRKE